jgi:hypothetical protein
MSLIDTWAATAVGAYSLTENGLYTIEAWQNFLNRLTPDGVFTVSRWYGKGHLGETGRLISLAKSTLLSLGVEDPNRHIFLATSERLSTIIVSRAPLKDEDLATLREATAKLAFDVKFDPVEPPENNILRAIHAARTAGELKEASGDVLLDYSAPTDDRPFFFNQLRLSALPTIITNPPKGQGVIDGNLIATGVLAIIILISFMTVLTTCVVPTLPALRRVDRRLAFFGTSYFLLIGLGFMFVEIGLMQRLSIFLGHPVYGLAIALAGIILATGVGSAISERVPLNSGRRIFLWVALTVGYIGSLPFWFPALTQAFASSEILVRGLISMLSIIPAGVALGYGFPTGMRLVSAIDTQPTPWFWAVNGSAGVLASGIAVAIGIFISINASFWVAALCYLTIGPITLHLLNYEKRSSIGAQAMGLTTANHS